MKRLLFALAGFATLVHANSTEAAKPTSAPANYEDYLTAAQSDFRNYDFESASANLKKYAAGLKKAKESTTKHDLLLSKIEKAEGFLSRVEKIAVIDSISVPRQDFYNAVKLNRSAGRFIDSDELKNEINVETAVSPAYSSENGDILLWTAMTEASTDEEGNEIEPRAAIYESLTLSDGNRGEASMLDIATDGNILSPFMMADGQTLYFASDGKESIGGYDIFVTKRDPVTGEFFTPSNLGFPFNSPSDDLLMAFDEQEGVGWWATDRHDFEGENVTLYVFIPSEVRENYDPEETDAVAMARMDDFRSTWGENDYTELASRVRNITIDEDESTPDFIFPITRGVVYTSYEDFQSEAAADAMEKYIEALDSAAETEIRLSDLRKEWKIKPSEVRRKEILRLEQEMLRHDSEIRQLKNNVLRIELKTLQN